MRSRRDFPQPPLMETDRTRLNCKASALHFFCALKKSLASLPSGGRADARNVVERESVVDHRHIEDTEDHTGDDRRADDGTQHVRAARGTGHSAERDLALFL